MKTRGQPWGARFLAVVMLMLFGMIVGACDGILGIEGFEVGCRDVVVGARRCNGQQPQSCASTGQWQDNGPTCAHQTCIEGECLGVCAPSEIQCNGQQPQSCDVMTGQWQDNGGACADQTCVGGVCVGECAPGDRFCQGLTPMVCDANGLYASKQACGAANATYCSAGECVKSCTPGDYQCFGNIPQFCNANGIWQVNEQEVASHGVNGACDPCVGCNPLTGACYSEDPVTCGPHEGCGNRNCVCANPRFGLFASVGEEPTSLTMADFNGDGKPDLAVANANSNNVSVLLNNGNGTFANKVDYPAGDIPYSISILDFNNDGAPDLAIGNYYGDTVSVLLNSGNGTFGTKIDYATGDTPTSVAIGDLNGDGKPDIAVANQFSNTVSLLFNYCAAQ